MSDFAHTCRQFGSRLRRRAIIVALVAGAILITTASVLVMGQSPKATSVWLLALTTLGTGISTLALSLHLRFDAALFAMMAGYPNELAAGRAVDELLARRSLRTMPSTTRPLSDRIAGTERLMNKQLVAAAATGAAALALLLNLA